ncbi:unnamed protein product [Rotaria sp. Silwood2]|nr:unnamed protein product [Rotaria sp. Silwood2]
MGCYCTYLFVQYAMNIGETLFLQAELYFYNGTSKIPTCLMVIDGNEIYTDDDDICRRQGITWSMTTTDSEQLMTISHSKANFVTSPPCNPLTPPGTALITPLTTATTPIKTTTILGRVC